MDESSRFDFHRPRDLGDVINGTFTFLRQEFVPLGKSLLWIAGPIIVAVMALNIAIAWNQTEVLSARDFLNFETIMRFGALMLLNVLMSMTTVAVVNHYVRLYIANDQARFSVRALLDCFATDFWTMVGVGFLSVVIIFAGCVFLFIPGIYLAVALSLAMTAALHERLPVGMALKRSMQLVREYWWVTFGLLFLMTMIALILQTLFQIPFYIATIVTAVHGADPGRGRGWIIALQSISYLGYLLHGIPALSMIVHYYSQREKKEAAGLQSRIDALDVETKR
ncbi:MAG TPA: hypothetical protein VGR15_03960 [Bacteroidota bacterium]|jgi:hypothetical protein|nr:hypothetical protein [Bacteroidota bacterium]